jgi:hypothetical protein
MSLRNESHSIVYACSIFKQTLVVAIEAGAEFFDPSRPDPVRRGWYAFAPAKAQCYQVVVAEADSPEV